MGASSAQRATGFSWIQAVFVSPFMVMALAMTAGFTAVILAGAILYVTMEWVAFARGRAGDSAWAIEQRLLRERGPGRARTRLIAMKDKKGERLA